MELEVNDSVNVDYNWDDISVGNFQIDHSAHFFRKLKFLSFIRTF